MQPFTEFTKLLLAVYVNSVVSMVDFSINIVNMIPC